MWQIMFVPIFSCWTGRPAGLVLMSHSAPDMSGGGGVPQPPGTRLACVFRSDHLPVARMISGKHLRFEASLGVFQEGLIWSIHQIPEHVFKRRN